MLLLVLVPGLALAYVGLRGLAEQARTLRSNYSATALLVRDRLMAALAAREQPLSAAPALSDDARAARQELAAIEAANTWLRCPVLIRTGGVLISSRLTSKWTGSSDDSLTPLETSRRVADAEREEFVRRNLDAALRTYREALSWSGGSVATRAFLLTRLGRTSAKLGRLADAAETYRRVLAVAGEARDANGLPYAVIALLQLIELQHALGHPGDERQAEQDLRRYVVEHPWDLDDGYRTYLNRAVRSAPASDAALVDRAQALLNEAEDIDWIQREVWPGIAAEPRNSSGAGSGHLILIRGDRPVLIGYQRVQNDAVLAYEVRWDIIDHELLAGVVSRLSVDGDARVTPLRPSAAGAPLAEVDLLPPSSALKVALVDRRGRSIDELVARQRWAYTSLIVGMLGVMCAGVALTVRASARSAELSRLKSEFVSNVSHELKTPLALIRMFGETLESGIVHDHVKRREFYGIIRRESERLTHLINNVLDIGRIDAGTKRYDFARVDLVATVRQAVDAYRPLFGRLDFEVDTAFPDSPVELSLDRDAVIQALINLFQNVIKYSPERRYARVGVSVDGGTANVSVADHGIGIAREHLGKIFDRHFRVSAGESIPSSAGSGLGLSIVTHTMDAHGGRVEVASEVGQGSVFRLVFPTDSGQLTDVAIVAAGVGRSSPV